MPRVKRGVIHLKKRKNLLKAVKGYTHRRKKTIKLARPAMLKAGVNAFRDRRAKKRTFRSLWLIQINAACRALGLSYSVFMNGLKKADITIDRKILALLARDHASVFEEIVKKVKAA